MKLNIIRQLLNLFKKLKERRIKFFTIISIAIAAIGTFIFIICFKCHQNNASFTMLASAYTAFFQGDQKKGVEILDETISKYVKMPVAYQARLLRADIFTELGAYEEALNILHCTIKHGKPAAIKPLAQIRVIYVFDTKKDYVGAIAASKEFISKYADHYLVRDVYLNLAEYYMLYDSKSEAIKVFNEVLINFPTTLEAQKAQNRLNKIK